MGSEWTEAVQAISAVLGVVGIAGALVYSARQVRLQTESQEQSRLVQRAQLDLSLMRLMMDLDVLFVERPHLYPYFNSNEPVPLADQPLHGEVLSCAELILDYADMIARQQRCGQIPDSDVAGWTELLSSYYAGSPAVRREFERFERGYQQGVRRLLAVDRYRRLSADAA